MYKVTIQTTKGFIEAQIERIEDLEDLIAKYYDIYIGFRLEQQKDIIRLERKQK